MCEETPFWPSSRRSSWPSVATLARIRTPDCDVPPFSRCRSLCVCRKSLLRSTSSSSSPSCRYVVWNAFRVFALYCTECQALVLILLQTVIYLMSDLCAFRHMDVSTTTISKQTEHAHLQLMFKDVSAHIHKNFLAHHMLHTTMYAFIHSHHASITRHAHT